jgi:hypothetical protein
VHACISRVKPETVHQAGVPPIILNALLQLEWIFKRHYVDKREDDWLFCGDQSSGYQLLPGALVAALKTAAFLDRTMIMIASKHGILSSDLCYSPGQSYSPIAWGVCKRALSASRGVAVVTMLAFV